MSLRLRMPWMRMRLRRVAWSFSFLLVRRHAHGHHFHRDSSPWRKNDNWHPCPCAGEQLAIEDFRSEIHAHVGSRSQLVSHVHNPWIDSVFLHTLVTIHDVGRGVVKLTYQDLNRITFLSDENLLYTHMSQRISYLWYWLRNICFQ